MGHPLAEDVVRLADSLAARVKAVAFDMDQCIVRQHSYGRLSKVRVYSSAAPYCIAY